MTVADAVFESLRQQLLAEFESLRQQFAEPTEKAKRVVLTPDGRSHPHDLCKIVLAEDAAAARSSDCRQLEGLEVAARAQSAELIRQMAAASTWVECRRIWAEYVVGKAGSIRAASMATGVPRSTLGYWKSMKEAS